MKNRDILCDMMSRYQKQSSEGTIGERIESVLGDYVPTLSEEQKSEERQLQYRAFLLDLDKAMAENARKVNAADSYGGLPAMLAGSIAGARIGRVAGFPGMLLGTLVGGFAAPLGLTKAAEAYIGRSLAKIVDNYSAALDRMDTD